jgi:hypothetical protein
MEPARYASRKLSDVRFGERAAEGVSTLVFSSFLQGFRLEIP